MIAIYRFFNFKTAKFGQSFPLCPEHMKKQLIPYNCILEKTADSSHEECVICKRAKYCKKKATV